MASLTVCIVSLAGIALLPPAWPGDEAPSLVPASHELPLSAIAEHSGFRIGKQARSHRPVIKKPERSIRQAPAERSPGRRPSNPTAQAFRGLPRRPLYAGQERSGSSDDPGDPLPS